MQIQQSLFSLQRVIVRKIPCFVWGIVIASIVFIICTETLWLMNSAPLPNYNECVFQFYQKTRTSEVIAQQPQQSEQDPQAVVRRMIEKMLAIPYDLKPEYYKVVNSSTSVKLYLEDGTQNENQDPESSVNCKILLNVQSGPSESDLNDMEKADIINQKQTQLIDQHPFMHMTGNQHILYIDPSKESAAKHAVKSHSIILKKSNEEIYPQSYFRISSRLWRMHTNQEAIQNQRTIQALAQSFKTLEERILQSYKQKLESENQNRRKKNQKNQQEFEKKHPRQRKADAQQKYQKATNEAETPIGQQTKDEKPAVPDRLVLLPILSLKEIYPVSSTFLYFHYSSQLHYQELTTLIRALDGSFTLLYKLIVVPLVLGCLIFISLAMGLFVRYLLILALSIYLLLGGCLVQKQWGWVSKYLNLIRNRDNQNNFIGSCKMTVMYIAALLIMTSLFTYGVRYSLEKLFIVVIPLSENFYSLMVLKNYFLIELFYYIFCRSRVSLRAFPVLSLGFSLWIFMECIKNQVYNVTWFVNLHLWTHLFLMACFCLFENQIGNQQFHDDYVPSLNHPRALYYPGYDISWENSLAPIWTYFATYYDLSLFGEKEKSYIDRDYQLLYGRMLGMNDRQELPEDQNESEGNQQEAEQLNQILSESNEMNLIR